jgi:hypothetical protein
MDRLTAQDTGYTDDGADARAQVAAEIQDHVNDHIRKWETTLRNIEPDGFYIALGDRRADAGTHFVIFDDYEGERRLIEIEILPNGGQAERLLVAAPRAMRVEVLRRLPKAFEGVLIRRRHGTG